MTSTTKHALTHAFLDLLETKPLDRITVKELVACCGVSRNTFYYHYHDIYSLADELFDSECTRLARTTNGAESLEQVVREALRLVREHTEAIRRLYRSTDHDRVLAYLKESSTTAMRGIIYGYAKGLPVSKDDLDLIVRLCAGMVEGILLDIVRDESDEDIDALITRSSQLLEGAIERMLEGACTSREARVRDVERIG